jgi:hypothetical protein
MPNSAAEQLTLEVKEDFRVLGDAYYEEQISAENLKAQMKERLKAYYIALALIAADGEIDDPSDLEFFIGVGYSLIDDLIETIQDEADLSRNYILWRVGIFSFAHHVYTRYTVDEEIFRIMPVFPGVDCLGDGACGCDLIVDTSDSGVSVEWVLGPTEHCVVCLAAAVDSPFEFSWDEIETELDF